MTIPKAQQVERMSNVIVERRPKSRLASRDAVLPPGTPTPRRADPLNPALPGAVLRKLRLPSRASEKPPEPAPEPSPAAPAVEVPIAPAVAPAAPAEPGAQAAKKAAWQARKSALYLRLRKLSPALFAVRAAPFAIGINTEIIRRLELVDIQDLRALGVILHFTVTHPRYLRALAAEGAMRHDLDGNPVEPVSAEHRELAQAMLDKLACKAKSKKQAGETHG